MAEGGREPSVTKIEYLTEDVDKCDDDSGITMVDVLEEEQELEEDANAVLGGSDDQNCTYPLGYVKRQALYACSTCTEDSQLSAGICLACSYSCHEGHRLIELYTKRGFRCDCGNSKFRSNQCKLFSGKDSLNPENSYNQNFQGVYCTCARPYPDPDDDIEDEMIQCIICEDWYHGRHLGTPIPANNEYGEMICAQCMEKCGFLLAYNCISLETCSIEAGNISNVDLNVSTDEKAGSSFVKSDPHSNEIKKELNSKSGSSGESCFWKELMQREVKPLPNSALFWPDGWRKKLCKCADCMRMYIEKNLRFLLDDEDTVHSYEERGKNKNVGEPQSRYDQGLQALSQMDRIRQVEAIHEYNDMKSELKDFLKNFAENKKVVRKEDIDEFFSQMRERKRRRLEVSIPHYCR